MRNYSILCVLFTLCSMEGYLFSMSKRETLILELLEAFEFDKAPMGDEEANTMVTRFCQLNIDLHEKIIGKDEYGYTIEEHRPCSRSIGEVIIEDFKRSDIFQALEKATINRLTLIAWAKKSGIDVP